MVHSGASHVRASQGPLRKVPAPMLAALGGCSLVLSLTSTRKYRPEFVAVEAAVYARFKGVEGWTVTGRREGERVGGRPASGRF